MINEPRNHNFHITYIAAEYSTRYISARTANTLIRWRWSIIHTDSPISIIPCIKIINQLPYFRHQLQKVTEVNIVNDFAL